MGNPQNDPETLHREKKYESEYLAHLTLLRANKNAKPEESLPDPAKHGITEQRAAFLRFAIERSYSRRK